MNKLLFLSIYVFAFVDASTDDVREWNEYKSKFSKIYADPSEDRERMEIFLENKQKIEKHNERFNDGLESYSMSLNAFSDMPYDDITSSMREVKFKRSRTPRRRKIIDEQVTVSFARVRIPQSIDWRKKGAVSPVKSQGECGSCWAFSVLGAIEGQQFIKNRKLVPLSAQNLVDCISKNADNDDKCDGNFVHSAFDYIKRNGGIDSEHSYPYKGYGSSCKYRKRHSAAKLKGYKDLPVSEEKLQHALAFIGPISVSIDALHPSFQFYSGGIYYEKNCGKKNSELNHSVLAVGYGSDGRGKDYWIIKNSYGPEWGEKGYMRLARNRHNHCGVATEACYPIV